MVDTNLIVATALETDQVCWAVLAQDADWIAPPLWESEFRNAIAGHMRNEGMSPETASRAFRQATALVQTSALERPTEVFLLVEQSSCTAYDLEFVALAQSLDVPLVTFDRQLLDQFSGTAVHPVDFAA